MSNMSMALSPLLNLNLNLNLLLLAMILIKSSYSTAVGKQLDFFMIYFHMLELSFAAYRGMASSSSLSSFFSPCSDLGVELPFSRIGEMGKGGVAEEEELSEEDGMPPAEKKRRLNVEQVRTLEKNFDQLGNKLEPERKMQLAVALGLQPRQVAIWFQNRRARWKTKQLEKDYEELKRQLEAVKSENEALQAHNSKLQTEIMALRGREQTSELINLNKETEGSCSENSSEINLDMASASLQPHQVLPFLASITPAEMEAQRPKAEHGGGAEGTFSNLLCSMEDHHSASFWPWPDHHSFH